MSTFVPRGCFTALVTPFTADGTALDLAAYEQLIEAQVDGGVSGVVPCGTTGETPTLTDAEQVELLRRTVKLVRGRTQVVAGTGTNGTKKTIDASRAAFEAGVDAVMIVMPYYNKPSQEGLFRHVEAVAKAVPGPVVLYNVPGRTIVDLGRDTLARILDACPNVVSLKDASGNVLYCQALAGSSARFSVLCGDDALTVPMMSVGATGVISVTSNLYPREVTRVVTDALAGNWASASAAHVALMPVHAAMFVEPNPAPIKAALAARGRMSGAVRLPMVDLSEPSRAAVVRAIDAFEGR